MFRIGHGYDAHRFADNRKFILGGVEIPHEKGLLGHSDADVLTHALIDAILGALALGDIGKHFPPSDNTYKDIDSLLLLRHTAELMREAGYKMGNADCTIIAQKPKLAAYLDQMRMKLVEVLDCDISQVSVKATTEEHMGFTGRLEGVAAHAVVLVNRR